MNKLKILTGHFKKILATFETRLNDDHAYYLYLYLRFCPDAKLYNDLFDI